jgi:DNA polymerase-3 subunit delta'
VVGIEPAAGNGRGRVLIGIDQVREVQREASLTPFEGSHRVVIFDGAERLSEEAANSLLKFLEEPPAQVVLLLLTSDIGALPSTIVSRCQGLELRAVPPRVIAQELVKRRQIDADAAEKIARLSEGRPGWALRAAEDSQVLDGLTKTLDDIEDVVGGDLERRFAYAAALAAAFDRDRDPVRQELETWTGWWRSVLLVKEGVPEFITHLSRLDSLRRAASGLTSAQVAGAIDAIEQSATYLERNVNSRLMLEELMLALPRPQGLSERNDAASRP